MKWTTSDSLVASVKNGTVTGKRGGTATITLTVDKVVSASIDVLVIDDAMPTELRFAEDTPTRIGTNNTFDLTPYLIFTPDTANKTLTWKSSNSKIVGASNKGTIHTGKKTGTVTVTATSNKNREVIASIDITVFGPESITFDAPETMRVGQTCTVTPTYAPEGVAIKRETWASSDTKVATINKKTGLLTAVGPGRATITLTADDLTASFEFEVQ